MDAESENIDIKVGGKLTARLGKYTVGLLNTYLGRHGNIKAKNLLVFRPIMQLFEESRLGAILTYGNPLLDDNNNVVGIDFRTLNSSLFDGQILFLDSWVQ